MIKCAKGAVYYKLKISSMNQNGDKRESNHPDRDNDPESLVESEEPVEQPAVRDSKRSMSARSRESKTRDSRKRETKE